MLGLSDDRKVWMWTQDTALLIKPAHVDIEEHRVTKVVAGITILQPDTIFKQSLEANKYRDRLGSELNVRS